MNEGSNWQDQKYRIGSGWIIIIITMHVTEINVIEINGSEEETDIKDKS